MRHLGLLPLAAMTLWLQPRTGSKHSAHAVTLHLTAFTSEAVVVHIVERQLASARSTVLPPAFDSVTVRTPADFRVDSAVKRVQLSTEGNLAIRVRFTEGASDKERALAPWGRRLMFVRTADGDLEPEAEVTPAQPTTHPRNDERR